MYKTAILPLILYGCKTWSPTLREEHRMRVFENSVLRIFGPKRKEESWRKVHNDELHGPHSSPNIVRVIKSRRMKWVEHRACMGRRKVFTGFWLGGPNGRDHWKDLSIGGRITLRWILRIWGLMEQTGFDWLRIGSSDRFS
jgi:hypothetical protein